MTNRPRAVSQPRSARGLLAQANSLRRAGDWIAAEEIYRNALTLDPRCSDVWLELGCLLLDSRRFAEAAACFRHFNQANSHLEPDANPNQAVRLLAGIASARPDWTAGQFSLGCAYEHLGDFDQARVHLARALQLDPSRQASVQSLYARMYCLEKRWIEAVAAADRALAANPDYFLAHLVRGRSCAALSRMDEAIASKRRALEVTPDLVTHSDLILEMNYLSETTPESVYQEARRWNSLYAAPLASEIRSHPNSPDPERRLRVGYVSPDLYHHTVMKFLPQVFEHHDRSRYEVFLYDVGRKSDQTSEAIRSAVEHYASLPESYNDLGARVRADKIDILVDLAGHTMGPALLAFALKPAPVQVSWLGYTGTTGMSAIDYFLGDAEMPCPGTEPFFSEKVYRLPRVECCYRPAITVPIAPSPCLSNGHITFGCFNNPRKITRQVVMLWSTILHMAGDSLLLLKYGGLEAEVQQDRLIAWFQEDGIQPERLLFEGKSPYSEYLASYNRIDIALDPFPYNGSSTTQDALWMGVPVVTLAGSLAVQSAGASILTAAGLRDLVARTPEQYVKTALFLAGAVRNEPELRADIRNALKASPWMDEVGLVRDVENAYREMWRAWCRNPS